MSYKFAPFNAPRFDMGKVFAIATDVDNKRSPVRLEVSRQYVEDIWGLNWNSPAAVLKKFTAERDRYLDECEKASLEDYNAIGVYRIG